MANLPESPTFHAGIFQLETNTPAKGGTPVFSGGNATDGHLNAAAKQLADRTAALRDAMPNNVNTSRSNFDVTVTDDAPYNLSTFRPSGNYTLLLTQATGLLNEPADIGVVNGDVLFFRNYVGTSNNRNFQILEVVKGANRGDIWTRANDGVDWSPWRKLAVGSSLLTQNNEQRLSYSTTVTTGSPANLNDFVSSGFYSLLVSNASALSNHPLGSGLADGDVIFLQVQRDQFFYVQRLWQVKSVDSVIQEPDYNEFYRAYVTNGVTTGWTGWQIQTNREWVEVKRAEAIAEAAPPGAVMAFAMSSPPAGWLRANGAAVSRTTYVALFAAIGTVHGNGDGSTTFNVPDLRGEFVRGWDNGRGIDSGRTFGTAQADELKAHNHLMLGSAAANGAGARAMTTVTGGFDTSTQNTGGAETRPRNIALLYCIKI